MKILVIDDFAANIASANVNMAGHEVTAVDTIKKAYEMLRKGHEFDGVLTDLNMPVGDFVGAMNTRHYAPPTGEIPAGLVFAIKAANKGIRTVICTDSNHHNDWICSLLDLVGKVYKPGTEFGSGDACQNIAYVEARHAQVKAYWDPDACQLVPCEDYDILDGKRIVKDWLRAMVESGLFPELSKAAA